MKIALIVAMTADRVIGSEGAMPWHLPADLAHFKSVTMGKPVMMGRKTYDSLLVKPLPGRLNIVVSRDTELKADGCRVVGSIEQAVVAASGRDCLFVIGGATLYEQMLDRADEIYLTRIHAQLAGDTYFPSLQEELWQQISCEFRPADEKNNYDMEFVFLRRKA